MLLWLFHIVLIGVVSGQQRFFMQLFADAGIGIHCPSGNQVYIHPISGDLQQCSQQLGVYNETSCPGGTVCERFPILIPGFQDYCCWSDEVTDSEEVIIGSTTAVPKELLPYTNRPDRPVVEAIIEAPDTIDSNRGGPDGVPNIPEEAIEIIPEESGGSVTQSPEDGDEEWEFETTRRTKRPRSRKVSPTTTEEPPTTTTKKPAMNRRLPQCNNPEDTALIDFGNRLRDCYFQQCYQGYRCEFNKDIRRFICCGKERDVVPPPGLPRIPNPKPLVPRPFRPRPFGLQNNEDGDDHQDGEEKPRKKEGCAITGCPHGNSNIRTTLGAIEDTTGYSNNVGNEGNSNGHGNGNIGNENGSGNGHGNTNTNNGIGNNANYNSNDNNGEDPWGCKGHGGHNGCPYSGGWNWNNQNNNNNNNNNNNVNNNNNNNVNNNNNNWGDQSWNNNDQNRWKGSQGQNGDWNNERSDNHGNLNGKSNNQDNNWNDNGCPMNNRNGNGCRWNNIRNGNNDNDRPNSWKENEMNHVQTTQAPGWNGEWDGKGPYWGSEYNINMGNNNINQQGINPNWGSSTGQPIWADGGPIVRPVSNAVIPPPPIPLTRGTWNEDPGNTLSHPGHMRKWKPASHTGEVQVPTPPSCLAGQEYNLGGAVPKCLPPGTDSCPLSHPRCAMSPTIGYNVCCL